MLENETVRECLIPELFENYGKQMIILRVVGKLKWELNIITGCIIFNLWLTIRKFGCARFLRDHKYVVLKFLFMSAEKFVQLKYTLWFIINCKIQWYEKNKFQLCFFSTNLII